MQSSYPAGFPQGVTLRGLPILQTHPGAIFWVSNVTTGLLTGHKSGSDGNKGTFDQPFATIDYAIGRCTANRGDIIIVKPGHAETITTAAQLLMDVAGIAIVGLGYGANRPKLTFGAAAANVPITAANMSIQNFLLVANFADVASMFTATGTATPTDFSMENCEARDNASNLNALTVITGNATANSMDGLRFVRNRVSSLGTTAATTALKIASDTRRLTITDNFGCSAVLNDTAALLAASTAQITDFELSRNVWERPNTSSTGGSFISGSGNAWTGHAADNYFWQVDATAGIWIATGHGVAFGYSNNFSPVTGAVDRSALINPVAV